VTRVGWVDCSSGVSGDMLLGALADLGALDELPDLLERADIGATVRLEEATRNGLRGIHIVVQSDPEQPRRALSDLLAILDGLALPDPVDRRSRAVLGRLADAEAAVHGISRDEVHFHEVGAVDTIVDIVGVCLGLHALGIDQLTAGPVSLGGGTITVEHGTLPVPGPAVLELLRNTSLVATGGPVDVELATPTGTALLAELATDPPRAIVRWTSPASVEREPNLRGRPTGARVLDRWVADRYRLLARTGDYEILVPRAGG
jgi:uncharacterized protein (DUF111 family)